MKKAIFNVGLVSFSMLFISSCSPTSKFYYKNSAYFEKPEKGKSLYIDDIERVIFDDTAKAFSLYSLKMDSKQIEDTLTSVFNYVLKGLAKKYIKKVDVLNSNGDLIPDVVMSDSTKWQNVLLTSEDSISKEYHIPSGDFYDNTKIGKIDYLMQIKSAKISISKYFVPIFLPFPGGFIYGSTSGPCLILRRSYILWDFGKSQTICAGEFSKQMLEMNMLMNRKS